MNKPTVGRKLTLPGKDLHTEKASVVFNVPPEQVTREQRKYAKILNYTEWYGGINNPKKEKT